MKKKLVKKSTLSLETSISRRDFFKVAAATSAAFAIPHVWLKAAAAGPIKLGFIALTDSSSVIMAKELGLYKKYGVDVEVVKQASWAALRDGVLNNDIQGAHCLYGMPFSVYNGISGQAGKEMYIAMTLNNNGQAITLAKSLQGVGRDPSKLKAALEKLSAEGKDTTFAMTFPGGTHDMWLRYYLAHAGIDASVTGKQRIITIPPPQMVANMKVGTMIGYSVGEPWNGVGVAQDVGFTTITSQEVWKHHPEKALVVNKDFAARKDELKAVMKAILEASAWLDSVPNIRKAATTVGQPQYVNASPEVIGKRLEGYYDMGAGLGVKQYFEDRMLFSRGGKVSYPRLAHGIWFMAQYARFGYLKAMPADAKAIADKLILQDVYKEVAKEVGVPIPEDDMKPWTMTLDKVKFDPTKPDAYLKSVM
jgi:nitrate/nitrite transport system substrate-binding protein